MAEPNKVQGYNGKEARRTVGGNYTQQYEKKYRNIWPGKMSRKAEEIPIDGLEKPSKEVIRNFPGAGNYHIYLYRMCVLYVPFFTRK